MKRIDNIEYYLDHNSNNETATMPLTSNEIRTIALIILSDADNNDDTSDNESMTTDPKPHRDR